MLQKILSANYFEVLKVSSHRRWKQGGGAGRGWGGGEWHVHPQIFACVDTVLLNVLDTRKRKSCIM